MKNFKILNEVKIANPLMTLSFILLISFNSLGSASNFDFSYSAASGKHSQEYGEIDVNIRSFGMRGKEFIGDAKLSERGLLFEDSKLELSTIIFSLTTSVMELDQFCNPSLTYKNEPARIRIHISGEIKDYTPGEFSVRLTGLSLRMLDSNEQALGTTDAEELIAGLASNGIFFPEVNTAKPLEVKFQITASDENYNKIFVTSDADFFQIFKADQ